MTDVLDVFREEAGLSFSPSYRKKATKRKSDRRSNSIRIMFRTIGVNTGNSSINLRHVD